MVRKGTGGLIARIDYARDPSRAGIRRFPLAEQKRIVAKVDRLMSLVDQLEAAQNHSLTLSEQLLQSVLAGVTANV